MKTSATTKGLVSGALAGLALAGILATGPAIASSAALASQYAAQPDAQAAPAPAAFIPADFNAPTLVETARFKIVPLGPDLVKVDFDAYMSSIEHLQTTFTRSTGWPHKDITDADAMRDMETEQARFEKRESFAYAVLTPDGKRELGCVYVYPSPIAGYDAVVRMWVTKADYDAGFDAELYEWTTEWIAQEWPFEKVAYPGRAIAWDEWDALIAASKAEEP